MTSPSGPTILLPLDGSDLAERAIWLATEIAQRLGGRLLLLNVPEVYGLDPAWHSGATIDAGAPMIPVDQLMAEALSNSERYLSIRAADLRARGLTVETFIANEAPAPAIVRAADAHDAWMIVMATHGWSGVSRWAYGSVADKIIHTSETPLAVVPARAEHLDPALDHFMVALDGSREAERILDCVWPMARALGTRLTLVHVVFQPTLAFETAAMLEAEAGHRRRMEDYMLAHIERLREDGVEADYELLAGTDVAAELLEREAQDDVDLVALTTHGHGGFSRWAFGSVADRVVRSANTPVLVQRLRAGEGDSLAD